MTEQILKGMTKAPLDRVLQGSGDALETIMYYLTLAESKHELQEDTGEGWSECRQKCGAGCNKNNPTRSVQHF